MTRQSRTYRPRHAAPSPALTRRRLFGVLVVAIVALFAVVARLVVIQGVDAHSFGSVGKKEWQETLNLQAQRGSILDRNGDELAVSIEQTTIYADPHQVNDPLGEATKLAPALNQPIPTLQQKLSEPAGFVYLAMTQPDNVAKAVSAMKLPGVYSLQQPKTFEPAGQLSSSLIGQVGTDGGGLSGLQHKYNSTLHGVNGKKEVMLDPQGDPIAGGQRAFKAPQTGQDVVSTIDEPLQYDTEQALAQAMVAAKGQSAIALLMDTKTGQLLSVANLEMPTPGDPASMQEPPALPVPVPGVQPPPPGFPPTASNGQPVQSPSASALTETYEPGSVNKLITVAGALQQKSITPGEHFIIPNGLQVADAQIHDDTTHPTLDFTPTDILVNSSNIGAVEIAQQLGRANFVKYLRSFGLFQKTDIGFPGESTGLFPNYWSGTTLATMAFGQGVGVTATQMLAAYNTIANHGVYVPPKLVKGTVDGNGHLQPTKYPAPHQVVSPQVAGQVTSMLNQVVTSGTGKAADLSPYTVAGKTGTASVPSKGGYLKGRYVASFAGFVPSENPQITALVQIFNTPDFGASASAPAFAAISRDALNSLQIPPDAPQPLPAGVQPTTITPKNPNGLVATGTPPPGPVPGTQPPPPPAAKSSKRN